MLTWHSIMVHKTVPQLLRELQLIFDVERQLDHSFGHLFCG
jgi:hypothetical protein